MVLLLLLLLLKMLDKIESIQPVPGLEGHIIYKYKNVNGTAEYYVVRRPDNTIVSLIFHLNKN